MKINEVKRLKAMCSGRYIVAAVSDTKGRTLFPECQRPCPEYLAREVANISEIENAVRVAQIYTFTDLHGRTIYPEILDLETNESAGTWCLDCGAFVPVDTWHQHEGALPVGTPAPAPDVETEAVYVYTDGTWDRAFEISAERWSKDHGARIMKVRLGASDAEVREQIKVQLGVDPAPDPLMVVLDRDYATTEAQVISERCLAPVLIPAFCRAEPAPAPTAPLAGAVDFQKLDEMCIGLMRAVYVWPAGQWGYLGECGPESGKPSLDDCLVFRFPATLTDGDITALINEATISPAEPALLPCPFCDSTDIFVKNEGGDRPGTTSVSCRWCGANTGLWSERVQAVAAWNSRKPTTEKVK